LYGLFTGISKLCKVFGNENMREIRDIDKHDHLKQGEFLLGMKAPAAINKILCIFFWVI
jgi:hypothetical protein